MALIICPRKDWPHPLAGDDDSARTEEGKILGEPGVGSFLRRGLSPYAAPRAA
jgi:hypothetical protein